MNRIRYILEFSLAANMGKETDRAHSPDGDVDGSGNSNADNGVGT